MKKLRNHANVGMVYFLIAATLGVILRLFPISNLPINYKFFVHAHSHVALLGWVYIILTSLIYKLFRRQEHDRKYGKIFWFTQVSLIGMLLTFPFQGYALFSIIFSTLFLFASYWFYVFFLKHTSSSFKEKNSYKCINVALFYMIISSLGPWLLGIIMNTLGSQSIWYRLAIYFYLHFQYNAWMILALFGLLFYVLEQRRIFVSAITFKKFFRFINTGIVLSFFLSTLWTKPSTIFYILGGLGVLFQLLAFLILCFVFPWDKIKRLFSKFQWNLLKTVGILLSIKMLLQLVTAFPYFANLASTLLDFTIGYLHWTFLGVITLGLFLFLDYFKLMRISKKAYFIYLGGFFLTEALIFCKGVAAWYNLSIFAGYFELLALASSAIVISLMFLLITNLFNRQQY